MDELIQVARGELIALQHANAEINKTYIQFRTKTMVSMRKMKELLQASEFPAKQEILDLIQTCGCAYAGDQEVTDG